MNNVILQRVSEQVDQSIKHKQASKYRKLFPDPIITDYNSKQTEGTWQDLHGKDRSLDDPVCSMRSQAHHLSEGSSWPQFVKVSVHSLIQSAPLEICPRTC